MLAWKPLCETSPADGSYKSNVLGLGALEWLVIVGRANDVHFMYSKAHCPIPASHYGAITGLGTAQKQIR